MTDPATSCRARTTTESDIWRSRDQPDGSSVGRSSTGPPTEATPGHWTSRKSTPAPSRGPGASQVRHEGASGPRATIVARSFAGMTSSSSCDGGGSAEPLDTPVSGLQPASWRVVSSRRRWRNSSGLRPAPKREPSVAMSCSIRLGTMTASGFSTG